MSIRGLVAAGMYIFVTYYPFILVSQVAEEHLYILYATCQVSMFHTGVDHLWYLIHLTVIYIVLIVGMPFKIGQAMCITTKFKLKEQPRRLDNDSKA